MVNMKECEANMLKWSGRTLLSLWGLTCKVWFRQHDFNLAMFSFGTLELSGGILKHVFTDWLWVWNKDPSMFSLIQAYIHDCFHLVSNCQSFSWLWICFISFSTVLGLLFRCPRSFGWFQYGLACSQAICARIVNSCQQASSKRPAKSVVLCLCILVFHIHGFICK